VYVYYPVVHALDFTTFDIKLDELLEYKRKLAEDMLNGSGDITPSDFKIVDVVPRASVDDIDKRIDIDLASRMGWQHFECFAAALWAKLGYECYRTPATKDYGVDVVAILGHSGLLIQTKISGTDGHALNWDAVKEVVAGEAYYQRRHPNVQFEKICLTNQFFNKHAHENADLNDVKLLDRNELNILVNKHQVMMLEVERMLYAEWSS
jgi:Holliday junction resolvase